MDPATIAMVGGQAVSFLSKLFGSGGSSNATSRLNRSDTEWMYNKQSEQWRANTEWQNLNGYSLMKEGLMRAGYNPLMALGATPQQGATVSGSAIDSNESSRNFDMKQALGVTDALINNTNADTVLKKAQTEENISRSSLEIAQRIATDKTLPLDLRLKSMQVIGTQLNNELTNSQIGVTNAQKGLINQQTQESKQRTRLTSAQVKQVHQEIDMLKSQKVITDRQAQWLHDHPTQAAWTYGIGQWTGAVGNIFSGSAGVNHSTSVKK